MCLLCVNSLSITPFYMPHWNEHVVSDIRCYSDEEVLERNRLALLGWSNLRRGVELIGSDAALKTLCVVISSQAVTVDPNQHSLVVDLQFFHTRISWGCNCYRIRIQSGPTAVWSDWLSCRRQSVGSRAFMYIAMLGTTSRRILRWQLSCHSVETQCNRPRKAANEEETTVTAADFLGQDGKCYSEKNNRWMCEALENCLWTFMCLQETKPHNQGI